MKKKLSTKSILTSIFCMGFTLWAITSHGFTINNEVSEPLIIKANFLSKKQADVHQHIRPNQSHRQYEATHWHKQRSIKISVCYPTLKSTKQTPLCDKAKPMISKICNAHKTITIKKQPCTKESLSCQQPLQLTC